MKKGGWPWPPAKRIVLLKKGSWQPYISVNISVKLPLFFSFNHNPEKTLLQTDFGLGCTVGKLQKWCGLCPEEHYYSLGRSSSLHISWPLLHHKPSPKSTGLQQHRLLLKIVTELSSPRILAQAFYPVSLNVDKKEYLLGIMEVEKQLF